MQMLQKVMRSTAVESLPYVEDLLSDIALDPASEQLITQKRQAISNVLRGDDNRLMLIVGPCSIHDPQAGLEYAARLAELQHDYRDQLLIVMRTYFEKPRTRVGWKGLVVDPDLDGSHNMAKGLRIARQFLREVIQLELATATEFLDTTIYPYLSDLICWGAIGARTTESQIHRQMASGLPCPIGFKKGTDGNVDIAIDAIHAANASHPLCISGLRCGPQMVMTGGNPDGHVILRGGKVPNYSSEDVVAVTQQLEASQLSPRLIVDCSHGNSLKVAKNQQHVAEDLARQLIDGEQYIAGVMAESFLVGENQKLGSQPLIHGQSITDACLGWDDTRKLIDTLANAKEIALSKQFSTVA